MRKGWRRLRKPDGFAASAVSPMAVAIEKHIVASWKGGTSPDEAVRRASSDHMRIALNPISVACIECFFRCPNASPQGGENCLGCYNRVSVRNYLT